METNLVYANGAVALTNSILVANKFGKEHKHVLEAIRNLLKGCAENSALTDNQDISRMFELSHYDVEVNNGMGTVRQAPMFIMNRDGFTLLAMGFTGEKALRFKLDYIKAFNAMEETIKNPHRIPQTLPEALRLAADQAERIEEQERLIEHKDGIIGRLQPLADFAKTAFTSDTLVSISQAAKILKLPFGRNTLFKKLRESGIFFASKNEPKQKYVDADYFRMTEGNPIETSKGLMIPVTVYCTQKGLAYINLKFGKGRNNVPQLAKIV